MSPIRAIANKALSQPVLVRGTRVQCHTLPYSAGRTGTFKLLLHYTHNLFLVYPQVHWLAFFPPRGRVERGRIVIFFRRFAPATTATTLLAPRSGAIKVALYPRYFLSHVVPATFASSLRHQHNTAHAKLRIPSGLLPGVDWPKPDTLRP